MNNRLFMVIISVVALLIIAGIALFGPEQPKAVKKTNSQGIEHTLTTYKSPTCGCCGNWVMYMRGNGYNVEVVDTEDLDGVKEKYGIPERLFSCHTTIANNGQYFIEGHIPEESIARLLDEEPEANGIGMPAMPSGSPGMPGSKNEPFEISKVGKDSVVSLFEVI